MDAEADVVVVGARCAGSPLAVLLARRGLRVCLVDRATFPSETPSTHVLQPTGVLVLKRLGVLDELWAAGAAPLDVFTVVAGSARLDATIEPREFGGVPGMCVRRVTLDAILVAAAERAGVEVRTGTNMTGLIRDGARVTGVETNHGPIRAALVVGADGQHSRVAANVGAPEYAVTPAGRLFTWGYFRGVPRTTQIKLGRVGPHGYLAAPTDGDLYMAGVAPDIDRKADFHGDREAQFEAGLRAWPELWDVLAGAERDGPIRMVSAWHGFFRPAAGPGWVLLGDAGQFKDPTPGQGISDALRHAERLADVVAPLIGDPAGLDVALLRWWRWRDRDSREMHWLATDLGAPGPLPPLREWMIADLAATAEGRLAFMRMFNHEIPASEIFGPARLARAVAAVRRRGDVPLGAIAREAYGLVADGVRQVPASRPPKQWRLRRNPRRAGAPHASGSARDAAFASRS